MSRYTLNLQIDPQSLSMLYAAGQRITLGQPANNGTPNVAWIVFNPLQSNSVSWEDQVGLFASTSTLAPGANLIMMSTVSSPAQDASVYPYQPSMFFGPPTRSGLPPGTYGIQNNTQNFQPLTFGLTQAATVNGAGVPDRPTTATAMYPNMLSTFAPTPTIYVWLQASYGSSTFIGNLNAPSTRVNFGGGITSQTLRYDPSRGVFVPSSSLLQAENAATPHVEVSEPQIY
jgi:hypothetical protein